MDSEYIEKLVHEIKAMRRGGSKEAPAPHKLLMLLSVIDLAGNGLLTDNSIPFDSTLFHAFEKRFRSHAMPDAWCQPGPPFFHLRNSSFWCHRVKEGREAAYAGITRMGGGHHLITDNIEYAYLTPQAFDAISEPEGRSVLRQELETMLEEECADRVQGSRRLGMTFHETFPLVIPAVRQVLQFAVDKNETEQQEESLSRSLLKDGTTLGPNYVRSMPRYAMGAGLLDGRYTPTPFGLAVFHRDLAFRNPGTLWLMHYHLSAPMGPGPAFWSHLVMRMLRQGDELRTNDIAGEIGTWIEGQGGKRVSEKTLYKTASVFLGTYSRADSLGPLGIMEQIEPGRYLVTEPQPMPMWAFGYALADFWHANWSDTSTVSVSKTSDLGGPGSLLLMGSGQVNQALGALQTEGLVTVQRRMPPFQVYKQWKSPNEFLERLYA